MGAALGTDREVWAITGDGGFQMTLQELMTLVQDDIPVKIAIFDNKKLGMIRQWQEIIYAGNYHSAALLGPDYLKLAEAYGIPAIKASKPDEVDDAIRFAQAAAARRSSGSRSRPSTSSMMPAVRACPTSSRSGDARMTTEATSRVGACCGSRAGASTAPPPRAAAAATRGSTGSSQSSSTSPAS